MTTDLDSLLRDVINDAAGQARPVNLTRAALRTARHNRITRQVTAGTVAVVVAGTLAGGYALASAHRATAPTTTRPTVIAPGQQATPSVDDQPVPLPGGWYLAGGTGEGGVWVYDRVRQAYRLLPYHWAWPAPTGDLVAVEDVADTPGGGRFGVLDLRDGTVRWLTEDAGIVGAPEWTADGTRLVYLPTDGSEQLRQEVDVADAVTGQVAVGVGATDACTLNCSVTWLPGDAEIAVSRWRGDPMVPDGMTAFDATNGAHTRTLIVQAGSSHAWSPNGRYVVTSVLTGGTRRVGIVDSATGDVVSVLSGVTDDRTVYWAGSDILLAIEHGAVAVLSLAGDQVGTYPLPAEFIDDELPSFTLARG